LKNSYSEGFSAAIIIIIPEGEIKNVGKCKAALLRDKSYKKRSSTEGA
jgi:hypothetical protein